MAVQPPGGRVNQKARTRMAIVGAARELIQTGEPVTMPAVMAETIAPGMMALTRMPCGRNSAATERISPTMPALAAL